MRDMWHILLEVRHELSALLGEMEDEFLVHLLSIIPVTWNYFSAYQMASLINNEAIFKTENTSLWLVYLSRHSL